MAATSGTTIEAAPAVGQKRGQATTQLAIEGMTCGNCARHVTEALQGVSGVRSAMVSLDAHQATVRWEPQLAPQVTALIEAVQKEGFEARLLEDTARDGDAHQ